MFEGLKRWLGLQPKLNMHTVRMVHLSEQAGARFRAEANLRRRRNTTTRTRVDNSIYYTPVIELSSLDAELPLGLGRSIPISNTLLGEQNNAVSPVAVSSCDHGDFYTSSAGTDFGCCDTSSNYSSSCD